jgi:uncharacterized protein
MERRIQSTEVRASKSAAGPTISGYAARYGVLSGDLNTRSGSFKERIANRAFDRILRTKPDVVMLLNHDANHVLGRTASRTLTLRADDNGLQFECLLPNTQAGRDTHESIKRGDLGACSFAFNVGDDMEEWSEERGVPVRTLRDFSGLHDVSVVTYPAYPDTSVMARHNEIAAEVRSRAEQIIRRRPATLTQEQIDHLVDTRDLTKYPLSGWEKRVIANRKAAIDALLF